MLAHPILDAALELLGFPYFTPARLAQRQVDCSVFAEYVLKRAYPAGKWSEQTHAAMMIRDPKQPWSPVLAVQIAGISKHYEIGTALVPSEVNRWYLCQGWRSTDPLSGGHCWLWYNFGDNMGRVLEATNAPGATWWRADAWTNRASRFKAGIAHALLLPTGGDLG